MFGLLYQECLQTGSLVFIWIFHFILPRVIRLFRVYAEWWIISFTALHSLKTRWMARACPKVENMCVSTARDTGTPSAWQISSFITIQTTPRQSVWPWKKAKLLPRFSTGVGHRNRNICTISCKLIRLPCTNCYHWQHGDETMKQYKVRFFSRTSAEACHSLNWNVCTS